MGGCQEQRRAIASTLPTQERVGVLALTTTLPVLPFAAFPPRLKISARLDVKSPTLPDQDQIEFLTGDSPSHLVGSSPGHIGNTLRHRRYRKTPAKSIPKKK